MISNEASNRRGIQRTVTIYRTGIVPRTVISRTTKLTAGNGVQLIIGKLEAFLFDSFLNLFERFRFF